MRRVSRVDDVNRRVALAGDIEFAAVAQDGDRHREVRSAAKAVVELEPADFLLFSGVVDGDAAGDFEKRGARDAAIVVGDVEMSFGVSRDTGGEIALACL